MRAILATLFVPNETGHGGNHRAYQVKHDVESVFGAENVAVTSYRDWQITKARGDLPKWLRIAFVKRIYDYVRHKKENPIRFFHDSGFSILRYENLEFLRYYEAVVERGELPALCLIEHPGLAGILPINHRLGIPTFACPQNLESLDRELVVGRKWPLRAAMYDLANEVAVMGACEQLFLISRVENGFYGGLGCRSSYYPYLPVGGIAARSETLRANRSNRKDRSNLVLLVGSATHKTTREGMVWFIDQCKAHGLPKGMRLIICGLHTDKMLPDGMCVPGIELRGWVEQDQLDGLLIDADAVLCPQNRGFGALTKLPEFSCAGIPVIVPQHVSHALDVPPGVCLVDDEWQSWVEAMQRSGERALSSSSQEYEAWRDRQSGAFVEALRRVTRADA